MSCALVVVLLNLPPPPRDCWDRTPAHVAAIYGRDVSLGGLINSGEVNTLDKFGHTPLHYACYHGHDMCVATLVEEDVEWGGKEGESLFGPLHCAA